jgi:hypothetical protein
MQPVGSLAASIALTALAVLAPSVPESAGRPSAPWPAASRPAPGAKRSTRLAGRIP